MKLIFQILTIYLTLTLTICESWGVEDNHDVAILTKDNFKDFISKHQFVFVKYFAPWCGHCKEMAPGYEKLAKRMKDDPKGIPIAEVDATVEKELADNAGVKGFPSLKFYINGNPIDYSGKREEQSIYNWILKKSGPNTKEIQNLEELILFENKKLALLLLGADLADLQAQFSVIATNYEDIPFAYSTNPDILKKYNVNQKFSVILIKSFDDKTKIYENHIDFKNDEVKYFIEHNRYPQIMEFDKEAAELIFGKKNSAFFLFTENFDSEQASLFKHFAIENKGEILFSISKISSGLGAKLSEYVGITTGDEGAVRIVKFNNDDLIKYKLTTLTHESLHQFLDDFKAGKLQSYYKSEKIPESQNNAVKVIVGESFDDLVLKSDQHVLLEAYAPWCGHCKKLAPEYEKLAKKLADQKDILIANFDATLNEHPSLHIKGFPTIKFYKQGKKDHPIKYKGSRDLKGMVSFLEKHLDRKFTVETGEL